VTTPLREMMARVAQPGRVVWIGLRPAHKAPMVAVQRVEVTEGARGSGR